MNDYQPCKTVEEALNTAIGFEQEAADIYAEFAKIFAAEPELVQLWDSMRQDEIIHAQVLKIVAEKLSAEQLLELTPRKICESLEYLQGLFVDVRKKKIQTFDDAYNTAHQLEFSEINAIFKFMATELVPDNQHPVFLDNQVDEHLYKLLDYKHRLLNQKKTE
jgi:rubrerythrin